MNNLESHLTFIGTDEDTGQLRCGFLTELIDAEDFPIQANLDGAVMILSRQSGGKVSFTLPQLLLSSINQGAQFWVGNIGGSGDAWMVNLRRGH